MKNIISTIFISGIVLIILDFIFIYIISNEYGNVIINVQNSKLSINYIGAILCYILLIFSLYYFILRDKKPLLDAFLLGIVIYGVLETTNYTMFKKWEPKIVFIDTLWGGILFTSTTYITRKLMNYISK